MVRCPVAKVRKRVRPAPAPLSQEAQRVQEDKRRIVRELAAVRRVNDLARQLRRASAAAEMGTFALGRELVFAAGYSIVQDDVQAALRKENEELRAKVAELERQAAAVFNKAALEPV